MSDDETSLTPEQARARFGELLHQPTRTYRFFDGPDGGVWRPRFDMDRSLIEYRLYRPAQRAKTRLAWRPKER